VPETSDARPIGSWPENPLLEPRIQDELRRALGPRAAFDEPLARHTSLCVGGPTDAWIRPATVDELRSVLQLCRAEGLPWRILGGGFNTLVRDGGVRGVTLSLASLRQIEETEGRVTAGAGATHASLTRFCADHGRAGLEFGAGIPGTVGGWVRMNAGIRSKSVQEVASRLEILGPGYATSRWILADEVRWRYRGVELPEGTLVVGASFDTSTDEPAAIRARMEAGLAQRRATQPVTERSCGSVFKNPEGDFAGRLIEAAGLKGASAGAARISEVHANFIVTSRGATAANVLELIDRAREAVSKSTGIELELEVRVWGDAE